MTRWAQVRTRLEGFHSYPLAPEKVSFLRHVHRHMFHVTLWVEQFHEERDVEYILCLHWLDETLKRLHFKDAGSCEYMATAIGNAAQAEYPGRRVKVEVSEDGENGAFVEL